MRDFKTVPSRTIPYPRADGCSHVPRPMLLHIPMHNRELMRWRRRAGFFAGFDACALSVCCEATPCSAPAVSVIILLL